jgi:hypothetical protein
MMNQFSPVPKFESYHLKAYFTNLFHFDLTFFYSLSNVKQIS